MRTLVSNKRQLKKALEASIHEGMRLDPEKKLLFSIFLCDSVLLILMLFKNYAKQRVINLVQTQNFPQDQHLLAPDKHTYVRVSRVGKILVFLEI